MRIKVLKHISLNQFAGIGEEFSTDDFSVFRTEFKEEDKANFSFLQSSFRSDFFSVMKVVSGGLIISVDFQDFEVSKDCMILLIPSSIKQMKTIMPGTLVEGLHFTANFLSQLKLNNNLANLMEFLSSRYASMWQLQKADSELLEKLLGRITERMPRLKSHTYGFELLANSFTDFLYEIAEIGRTNETIKDLVYGRKEELAVSFLRLAMQNHRDKRNLSFYSDLLFVTAKHLSETVKEVTGKTAGEIIDELNLLEAKRLLTETSLSISEISSRLHFSSAAFFSKFFSRLSGHSPRTYRLLYNIPSQRTAPALIKDP